MTTKRLSFNDIRRIERQARQTTGHPEAAAVERKRLTQEAYRQLDLEEAIAEAKKEDARRQEEAEARMEAPVSRRQILEAIDLAIDEANNLDQPALRALRKGFE